MIYDYIFEIIKESDLEKVNKLVSKYTKVNDHTAIVWDVIACVPETVAEPGVVKATFILGKKYKEII